MLNAYTREGTKIAKHDPPIDSDTLARAVWLDMVAPSKDEEIAVEKVLGIEVPTIEEMQGVESSSQLYREGEATVMTIRLMSVKSSPSPKLNAVTLILAPTKLVTLRYGEFSPFRVFSERAASQPELLASSKAAAIGLLEAIVERVADILENIGDQLDKLSECLFTENSDVSLGSPGTDLEKLLQSIGRNGDLASGVRVSLHSIDRVTPAVVREHEPPLTPDLAERLATLNRDVKSLLDHDAYVTAKIQFCSILTWDSSAFSRMRSSRSFPWPPSFSSHPH